MGQCHLAEEELQASASLTHRRAVHAQRFRLGLAVWRPHAAPGVVELHARRAYDSSSSRQPLEGPQQTVLAAATDRDGRAVVVRLVAKGRDGHSELKALRRLAKSPVGLLPTNHVLPYQAELVKDDMTFLIFALVGSQDIDRPWFWAFGEVVDMIVQILEVRSVREKPWSMRASCSGRGLLPRASRRSSRTWRSL